MPAGSHRKAIAHGKVDSKDKVGRSFEELKGNHKLIRVLALKVKKKTKTTSEGRKLTTFPMKDSVRQARSTSRKKDGAQIERR